MSQMRFTPFIEATLCGVASVAMNHFGRARATRKDDDPSHVVTAADLAVGEFIVDRIRRQYPNDAILDEELGALAGTSRRTWIVDPIDGTANFAAGSPLYGTMLAVLDSDKPVAGGVALPGLNEIYVAESGQGVHLNGDPLPARRHRPLNMSLVAVGVDLRTKGAMRGDWELVAAVSARCLGIRMSNSVFDAVLVARGVYAAYLHSRMRIWDIAPAQVLIEETGGSCTDLISGAPLTYADPLGMAEENFAVSLAAAGMGETIRSLVDACRETPC